MSGHQVPVRWGGRTVQAWVPDRLVHRDCALSGETAHRTGRAVALAQRGSDEMPPNWEALARLLHRSEGIASSFIEGVRAPMAEVAAAELDATVGEAPVWVADNLTAVRAAISEAHIAPLATEALDRWHRSLMGHAAHLPRHLVGAVRREQGWIGGTSPFDAALVTPPPEYVGDLLDDLVTFANRTDLDPITQAAVVHGQFETIHPYADGNGRLGRVLIGWVLTRRLGLIAPPPVSVRMAADRGGYLSGLTLFRLGQLDPWVRWFADVVVGASEATVNLIRSVAGLQLIWADRLGGVRRDAVVRRALALLPQHPVLAAATISGALDVSERTGRAALAMLASRSIVEPFHPGVRSGGRPRHWWAATELIDLVTAWSR